MKPHFYVLCVVCNHHRLFVQRQQEIWSHFVPLMCYHYLQVTHTYQSRQSMKNWRGMMTNPESVSVKKDFQFIFGANWKMHYVCALFFFNLMQSIKVLFLFLNGLICRQHVDLQMFWRGTTWERGPKDQFYCGGDTLEQWWESFSDLPSFHPCLFFIRERNRLLLQKVQKAMTKFFCCFIMCFS